jgi:hypothetical protein
MQCSFFSLFLRLPYFICDCRSGMERRETQTNQCGYRQSAGSSSEQTRVRGGTLISRNQCSGSMAFWCGSGSGSTDPCLRGCGSGSGSSDPCLRLLVPDADPDPAIFVIAIQEANKKLIFCLMIEGSRFIPRTGGSGSESGRPKNMWIRIRNTARNSNFRTY